MSPTARPPGSDRSDAEVSPTEGSTGASTSVAASSEGSTGTGAGAGARPGSEGATDAGRRGSAVRWWHHLVLVLVLVVSGSLVRWGQANESPTEDEWAHLTRGIVYWTTGDTRLSYAHPPLANALVTIGVAQDDDIPDFTTYTRSFGKRVDSGRVALGFIKHDYASAKDKLRRAREAMTWVFLAGVAYAYFWGLRLLGWPTAVIAAVFVGFNPTVMGQARYVTTDLPAGIAIFIAVGEFSRHLVGDGGRHTRWVTMPLALAAAMLAKHSAALLVPMFAVVGLCLVLARRGIYRGHGRLFGLGRFFVHTTFVAMVVLLAINAAYRFQHTGLTVDEILERPEPKYWISSGYKDQMLEEMTPLPELPGSWRIPLPYTELFGLGCMRAQNKRGYPMAMFWGEHTSKGTWLYFPTMLLFKTPVVILVLVLLGGPLALWRLRMRPPLAVTIMVVIALMYLALAMRSQLNMGVRHALPVEVMLSMIAAVILGAVWATWGTTARRRAGVGLAVALVIGVGIEAGPHYLGWYNALIGRARGHEISAVGDDWGQDRKAFVDLAKRYQLDPLHYGHQTGTRRLEVQFYELKYTPLECGKRPKGGAWVALHLLPLQARFRCFRYLEGLEPIFVVNDHVHVYWVPPKRRGKARSKRKGRGNLDKAKGRKAKAKAETKPKLDSNREAKTNSELEEAAPSARDARSSDGAEVEPKPRDETKP